MGGVLARLKFFSTYRSVGWIEQLEIYPMYVYISANENSDLQDRSIKYRINRWRFYFTTYKKKMFIETTNIKESIIQ